MRDYQTLLWVSQLAPDTLKTQPLAKVALSPRPLCLEHVSVQDGRPSNETRGSLSAVTDSMVEIEY